MKNQRKRLKKYSKYKFPFLNIRRHLLHSLQIEPLPISYGTRGDADNLFIIGIAVLLLLFLMGGGKILNLNYSLPSSPGSSVNYFGGYERNEEVLKDPNSSNWKGKIYLGLGNTYEIQPYLEYVTISTGDLPEEGVNISGWSLTNNKGNRTYEYGGNTLSLTSDKVTISHAAKLFLTSNKNYLTPIILHSGDRAILVTGEQPNRNPFAVTSFQVNKCSGYLENMVGYDFTPSLSMSCPAPGKEVGVNSLSESCFNFIERMPYCHTPEFDKLKKVDGNWETGYVDGVGGLSSQCKTYLKAHYSYEGCISYHAADKDFYSKEWRIFLNNPWELWAQKREVITLYDSLGKIVDQILY